MATVSEKLLTAEEFGDLPNPPDRFRQELVCGEVIHMPPAQDPHYAYAFELASLLRVFVKAFKLGRVMCGEVPLITQRNPDTVRGIDVAYWSYARRPEVKRGYSDIAPEIAAEILSPSNTQQEVREKIAEYLACGVLLVWIVDPDARTVTIHRPNGDVQVLDENAMLTGETVLPGFQCQVRQIFEI